MQDKALQLRRVELVLVPLVAALAMAFVIGAIVLDQGGRGHCTTLGWNNSVTIRLAGDGAAASAVTAVTACTGHGCVPPPPSFANPARSGRGALVHENSGSWLLPVGMSGPTAITVRAYDSSGAVRGQQDYALNWTRIGGSDTCGGPMTTPSVALPVG